MLPAGCHPVSALTRALSSRHLSTPPFCPLRGEGGDQFSFCPPPPPPPPPDYPNMHGGLDRQSPISSPWSPRGRANHIGSASQRHRVVAAAQLRQPRQRGSDPRGRGHCLVHHRHSARLRAYIFPLLP